MKVLYALVFAALFFISDGFATPAASPPAPPASVSPVAKSAAQVAERASNIDDWKSICSYRFGKDEEKKAACLKRNYDKVGKPLKPRHLKEIKLAKEGKVRPPKDKKPHKNKKDGKRPHPQKKQ